MRREHVHEIVSAGDTVVGTVWWDSEKKELDSDNNRLLEYLKEKSYHGVTFHSGIKFLQYLGRMLKNGYVHARKADS